jgi:hypothetical protein
MGGIILQSFQQHSTNLSTCGIPVPSRGIDGDKANTVLCNAQLRYIEHGDCASSQNERKKEFVVKKMAKSTELN